MLSLHVAGHPEESITLPRLMVVTSSRLFLVSVGIGLMFVISMLSPFPRNAYDTMCLFLCYPTLCRLRALYKGTGHASHIERIPPDVSVE